MSIFASIPAFIIMGIIIIFPFIIGVYVYRDAKRRGMSAVLWALIAALVPSLIGLLIYLLVRGNYSDLRCPQCQTPVKEQYVICPKCGAKLRPSCPNCSTPVDLDWKLCPKCTQPLPEFYSDIQYPTKAKDKSLWKVLAIVIIIPILLIVILVLSLSASFAGGSSSFREVSIGEYFEEMRTEGTDSEAVIAENVKNWIDGIETTTDHAYALRYDYSTEAGNEFFFLVYVPNAGNQMSSGMGQSSSIFGTTLTLDLQQTGNGAALFNITSSADSAPNLKVKLNGKKIPCDVTTVDYNPTLFYIVPLYNELEPGATDFFMPERISVVKLEDNHNVGVQVVTAEDLGLNILVGIDSAKYLDVDHDIYGNPDGTGGYDFKDGFEIVIEYKAKDELVLHEDEIRCFVFSQDGEYYIIDSYRPNNGRIIRQVDEEFKDDFYPLLESLFE